MAAKNGHIDVAQYLVLECKVSLDSVAKVWLYKHSILLVWSVQKFPIFIYTFVQLVHNWIVHSHTHTAMKMHYCVQILVHIHAQGAFLIGHITMLDDNSNIDITHLYTCTIISLTDRMETNSFRFF